MYNTINIKIEHLSDNCKYLNSHEKYVIHIYLDYFNNYLTLATMSDHTGLNSATLQALIDNGRELHRRLHE